MNLRSMRSFSRHAQRPANDESLVFADRAAVARVDELKKLRCGRYSIERLVPAARAECSPTGPAPAGRHRRPPWAAFCLRWSRCRRRRRSIGPPSIAASAASAESRGRPWAGRVCQASGGAAADVAQRTRSALSALTVVERDRPLATLRHAAAEDQHCTPCDSSSRCTRWAVAVRGPGSRVADRLLTSVSSNVLIGQQLRAGDSGGKRRFPLRRRRRRRCKRVAACPDAGSQAALPRRRSSSRSRNVCIGLIGSSVSSAASQPARGWGPSRCRSRARRTAAAGGRRTAARAARGPGRRRSRISRAPAAAQSRTRSISIASGGYCPASTPGSMPE